VRIISHFQMQVAGSPFRRNSQQVINIHVGSLTGRVGRISIRRAERKLSRQLAPPSQLSLSMIARIVTFPKMT
jgi:hypothetical protein